MKFTREQINALYRSKASPRTKELAAYVLVDGEKQAAVAARLGLSDQRISSCVRRIRRLLGDL